MIEVKEYPVGLKGGLIDANVKYRGLEVKILVTEDVDLASAECYDWNLNLLNEGTIANVETPLFKSHYLIYNNGRFFDFSYFYNLNGDLPKEFKLNEILRVRDLRKRDMALIKFGSWVTYRLFEDNKSKILVGMIPYENGLFLSFTRYKGPEVYYTHSLLLKDNIDKSPLNPIFSEIFHRERYAIETILEYLSQSF